jgi:hypothetical protein
VADRAAVSAHLRARTHRHAARIELPEVILEVMSWAPPLVASFIAVSGGRSRLEDLPTLVAACLSVPLLLKGRRRQVSLTALPWRFSASGEYRMPRKSGP